MAEAVEGGERSPSGGVRLGRAQEELDVAPRGEELLAGERARLPGGRKRRGRERGQVRIHVADGAGGWRW